ncbi:hypothetical protein PM082_022311 [Marasmius tenuissimus]|nr:hypothetical protein PM082_022311 [Marasmius tenuissimus]
MRGLNHGSSILVNLKEGILHVSLSDEVSLMIYHNVVMALIVEQQGHYGRRCMPHYPFIRIEMSDYIHN